MKSFLSVLALAATALAAPNLLNGGGHQPHGVYYTPPAAHEAPAPLYTAPAAREEPAPLYTAPAAREEPAPLYTPPAAREEPAPLYTPPAETKADTVQEPEPLYTAPSERKEPEALYTPPAETKAEPEKAGYNYDTPNGPSFDPHSGSGQSDASFRSSDSVPVVAIVKNDRVPVDETGTYSFDVEGEDGTAFAESGANGVKTGSYKYILPDGEVFELKYTADETGFHPESRFLPPLEDFVLEQIAFAKENPQSEEPGQEGGDDGSSSGGSFRQADGYNYEAPAPAPAPAPSNTYLTPQ